MRQIAGASDHAASAAIRKALLADGLRVAGMFEIVCRDKHGREKWRDTAKNLVVNAGLNYLLDAGLSGGTPITSWFLGLTDGTPTVNAADTMGSHAGWVEVEDYDEAARQAWSEAGPSSQSITNSASPAVFTVSANGTTIGGLFLTSVNTKGGTTGTLYSAAAFSAGDKSLDDNDTLTVTYTTSLTAS